MSYELICFEQKT